MDSFAPDAVIVSLGFDSLAGDPEGTFMLTTEGFLPIGRRLRSLDRPLVLVQGGGYLPERLGPSLSKLLHGNLRE